MSEHVNIDRTFDASREEVWNAWTDPAQLAEWWGPGGFHTPIDSIDLDLRAGGHLHLTMVQTENGSEYPVRFQVVELVERELLVLYSPAQPELGLTTDTTTRIEFLEEGARTRIRLTDGPYEGEMAKMADMGWSDQFDKLDGLLSRRSVGEAGDRG